MEEVRICTHCGEELGDYEGTTVGDDLLCDCCVDEHCTTCDHCGDTIWINDAVQDECITLCQECYDEHWTIVNKVDKKERKDHREESKMAGGMKYEAE